MRPFRLACVAAAVLAFAARRGEASAAPEAGIQRPGRVCPDPAHPCPGFKPHDLSFVLPRGETARAEARSDGFYAVILRSGPRCSIPEAQRVAAQALFPGRKVFSQRFECGGDVENNVTYRNVAADRAFLAVYAGATRQQASATLASIARTGRFPGANLRQTRVIFVYP
ncbi:MAG TPA: hypothetical protein VFJ16_02305 [Longimicrobium sp.]|nr:hypothetical protein [Longimicrobium sp.]